MQGPHGASCHQEQQVSQEVRALRTDFDVLQRFLTDTVTHVSKRLDHLERPAAVAVTGAQQAAEEGAEARAAAAEARAAAAERALAEVQEEVSLLREEETRRRAECEELRAALVGIREAGQCPILHGPCRDPVVASDGQTYERRAIEMWLRSHGTSPFTREPLHPELFANRFAAQVAQHLQQIGLVGSIPPSAYSEASEDSETESIRPWRRPSSEGSQSHMSLDPWRVHGSWHASDDGMSDASESSLGLPEHEVPEELHLWGLDQNGLEQGDPQRFQLGDALERCDVGAALVLLRLWPLPGLNELRDGWTMLHWAVAQKLPMVAIEILDRVDFSAVNVKDRWGMTALHWAAWHGSRQVCEAIVGRTDFREIFAVSWRGPGTASEIARQRGHGLLADILKNREDSAHPMAGVLLEAIQSGDEATALRILRQPWVSEINDVSDDNRTTLQEALDAELPEVALALLARQDFAGVNQARPGSFTVLHEAARRGYLQVCRAIVERADFIGALAVSTLQGMTGLSSEVARIHGHHHVQEFLECVEEEESQREPLWVSW